MTKQIKRVIESNNPLKRRIFAFSDYKGLIALRCRCKGKNQLAQMYPLYRVEKLQRYWIVQLKAFIFIAIILPNNTRFATLYPTASKETSFRYAIEIEF